MIGSSNSLSRGSGMPHQVDGVLPHTMSGTELSHVRTELRLLPPEPNNQRLLTSRGDDIVMQSSDSDNFICQGTRDNQAPAARAMACKVTAAIDRVTFVDLPQAAT